MSTRPVIVDAVAGQDAAQGAFAQDEGVVHPPAPDRADEPLREGVLPRAAGRRPHLTDSQALHSVGDDPSTPGNPLRIGTGRCPTHATAGRPPPTPRTVALVQPSR